MFVARRVAWGRTSVHDIGFINRRIVRVLSCDEKFCSRVRKSDLCDLSKQRKIQRLFYDAKFRVETKVNYCTWTRNKVT